jgi:tetratricopeptide (TPR) repeat protein
VTLPRLVAFYRQYLEDENSAAFLASVCGGYTLGALHRLAQSGDRCVRCAAGLALGMLGGAESTAIVGRAMHDPDRCVRMVAEAGFRDLCFRQYGDVWMRRLEIAARHNQGGRSSEALEVLGALLAQAPRFAEAWYQRGVALYSVENYWLALESCRQCVQYNSFHFAALTLQGNCLIHFNRVAAARKCFLRSLALNPGQEYVRGQLHQLRGS